MPRMANVTLGHEDVDWFDPVMDAVKAALWNEHAFDAYVEFHGVALALENVSKLHRLVANQMIEVAVTREQPSEWAWRAITVCRQAKKRRNQLRRHYRTVFGQQRYDRFLTNFSAVHPRAEWGSKVSKEKP